jgi:hypothetical protein
MAENEKTPDQTPKTAPKPTPGELSDESLERAAGGMGAAVPHSDHGSSLNSLATPVCLSQT